MPYSVQFNIMHDGLTGHVNVTISDGVNSANDKTFGANVNTFSLGIFDLSVTELTGANGEIGVLFRPAGSGHKLRRFRRRCLEYSQHFWVIRRSVCEGRTQREFSWTAYPPKLPLLKFRKPDYLCGAG